MAADDDLAAHCVRGADEWGHRTHAMLAWQGLSGGLAPAQRFDPDEIESFPDMLRIFDYRDLEWSTDSARLLFGVQKRDPAEDEPFLEQVEQKENAQKENAQEGRRQR